MMHVKLDCGHTKNYPKGGKPTDVWKFRGQWMCGSCMSSEMNGSAPTQAEEGG